MIPRNAFLLFTSHFLASECYDGDASVGKIVVRAASAMKPAERARAASFLEDGLRRGSKSLDELWKQADGQWAPSLVSQRDFTMLAIAALRNPGVPYRAEFRNIETRGR